MFSEPGAGSDLASLAMRAVRDGGEWVLTGQKVWSTWAHRSEFAICLARSDPSVPKRRGITYFLVDLRSPGVEVRELRHMGGEVDFNEVWLDGVRVPDFHRVGLRGRRLAGGGRNPRGRAPDGGRRRIGRRRPHRGQRGAQADRHRSASGVSSRSCATASCASTARKRVRGWTNDRVRATVRAGGTPGAAASIGKVHQGTLNQAIQMLATDMLGPAALAYPQAGTWAGALPFEVSGMFRSRANTIEGGTTEVNKNVIGEKVLGLPREPDPFHGSSWEDTPR